MRNYIRNLMVLVVVAGFVTACNKNNSNNNNAQTPNTGWGNGWNGGGVNGGQAIASGVAFQTSNGVLTGTAEILGDGAQFGNCIGQLPQPYPNQYQQYPINNGCNSGIGYGGTNILYTYVGQASIVGQMSINQNVQAGGGYYGGYNQGYQNNCVIPAGTYSLQTQQVGYYQQGVLQNFRLIASGPAQLEITMLSGTLTANGQLRMGMNAVIERINGQSCGQVPFSTF